MRNWLTCALMLFNTCVAAAREPDRVVTVWPGHAPGETASNPGVTLPRKENEHPPATRVGSITQPTLAFFDPPAERRTGVAVLICPGGGYNYVVVDKEGSEAAEWLNGLGITGVVLRYRTKDGATPVWRKPLQDAQRSLRLLRANADDWTLDRQHIGVLGFSAGGQLAALTATRFDNKPEAPLDAVDEQSCRPDFALLVYPWQLVAPGRSVLVDELTITPNTPPTFLVHTHDDAATSLSSVLFYARLKEEKVPAELHIYHQGGHGYGLRKVGGSHVHTWPDRAAEWLATSGIVALPKP